MSCYGPTQQDPVLLSDVTRLSRCSIQFGPSLTTAAPCSAKGYLIVASAMRRAEAAHGEHEKRTGEADPNRPDWYAEYIVAESTGTELPS